MKGIINQPVKRAASKVPWWAEPLQSRDPRAISSKEEPGSGSKLGLF